MDPLTIIAMAAGLLKLGEDLTQFIERQRATAQQTGEWTPEQEQAFAELQKGRAGSDRWKPQGE